MENSKKLCFIIAHKYSIKFKSYIKYYVDNIQKFYKDSFILIVDNNSNNIENILNIFNNYNNLKIIINNSNAKFELGAYNEGIRYILTNNLLNKYEYFVFSQDNYVLKNKFDVKKELIDKNILACSFSKIEKKDGTPFEYNYLRTNPYCVYIFNKINCLDKITEFGIAWCSSFILHKSKINDYYNIVKDIVVKGNHEGRCAGERFLSGICYYLNNNKYVSLGNENSVNPEILGYDVWTVDIVNDNLSNYFVKKVQQKVDHGVI